MSATAERIPLLVPPTGMETPVGDSVVCRAMTHRGLVRLHNEDSFCVETKADYHLFAIAMGWEDTAAAVSPAKWRSIRLKMNLKNGTARQRKVCGESHQQRQHGGLYHVAISSGTLQYANDGDRSCPGKGFAGNRARRRLPSVPRKERARGDINQRPFAGGRAAQIASNIRERCAATSRQTSVNAVGRLFAFPARGPGKRENESRRHLVLASDGLWSELDPLDIRDALLDDNIEKSMEQLVAMVLKAGAPDNLTAVIFRTG